LMDLSPYRLVIFDKDGTLIDFNAMWGGWVEALAARLEALTGRRLAAALFEAMDYDPAARRAVAGGRLAVTPLAGLRALTADTLKLLGLPDNEAEAVLTAAWEVPDPAATARALAPLPALFGALRERGLKIAVATADDRAATLATLASLGVGHLVDVVIAADDGVPLKPRPDMVLAACRATGVEPCQAIVVGDALPELEMARAAGAGLAVGVTSGVSSASLLAPYADCVLLSVEALIS
jgi:phosphoglycolate phosphatase